MATAVMVTSSMETETAGTPGDDQEQRFQSGTSAAPTISDLTITASVLKGVKTIVGRAGKLSFNVYRPHNVSERI